MPPHRLSWCRRGLHAWRTCKVTVSFIYSECAVCGERRLNTLCWSGEVEDDNWLAGKTSFVKSQYRNRSDNKRGSPRLKCAVTE